MISNKSASKLQSCPSPQGGTNPYSRPPVTHHPIFLAVSAAAAICCSCDGGD